MRRDSVGPAAALRGVRTLLGKTLPFQLAPDDDELGQSWTDPRHGPFFLALASLDRANRRCGPLRCVVGIPNETPVSVSRLLLRQRIGFLERVRRLHRP